MIRHLLLVSLFLSSVAKSVVQLFFYRRGYWMGKTAITNHIRRLRFEADEMTQAELAERIGVTRQTLIAIEQAKYSPTLELVFRIVWVFGVPLNEVFQYKG